MKKKSRKIYIILFSIAAVYYILKFSGTLELYTISSSGNEPTIKTGSWVLTTNLFTPERGDLITYSHSTPELGNSVWIQRLCGVENDTLEIKKGVLFVNGENIDQQFELQHAYILNEKTLNTLVSLSLERNKIQENTYMVFIPESVATQYSLAEYRYLETDDVANPKTQKTYQQNWNKDYFGPLVIPKGKVFMLGDNRDNSLDSRYIGLIDASAIKGVYWSTLFTIPK